MGAGTQSSKRNGSKKTRGTLSRPFGNMESVCEDLQTERSGGGRQAQ